MRLNRNSVWVGQFFLLVTALALSLGVLNFYADPFHYFRDDGVYVIHPRYQRYMNAGLLKTSPDFDLLVVGTSFIANFNPELIGAKFGGRAHILSTWGASQRENTEGARLALRMRRAIRTVLFETSIWNVCNESLHANWSFPIGIYNGHAWAMAGYLFSFETAKLSALKLSGVKSRFATDSGRVYRWWDQYSARVGDRELLEKEIAEEQAPAQPVVMSAEIAAARATELADCFERSPLSLARQYPQIRFLFFNPPVMQWHLWALYRSGQVESWNAAQEEIARRVAAVSNARYFDFYPAIGKVGHCRHWWGISHFDLGVGDTLVRWMAEGSYERTSATNAALSAATRAAASEKMTCG
jgi:hypothetical protein